MGHGRGENLEVKIGGKAHDHDPPIILRRKRKGNLKPMRSVSLHHHSTLSYQDGYGLPEAHVRRAAELQMGALAMTEHGNVDSHVKLEIAAEKEGIKPIYGVEFYTGPVGEDAKQIKYHLTVLAKNEQGYRNLMKLVSLSYDVGFYYEPTISLGMLKQYREGLIVLSGCSGSLLFCSLVGGKDIPEDEASFARAAKIARRFKQVFGDNYFLETQAFPELEKVRRANRMIERMGKKLGIRLVGTQDVHYTHFEEAEVQMILHNLRGGNKKTIEEQAREWGYDVPLSPPLSDRSFYRRLRGAGLSHDGAVQALVSTEEIAQECNVKLPKLPMTRFKVPIPGMSTKEYWEHQLREGWKYRGVHRLPASERRRYRKQLLKEKTIMEDKDFLDYMLIVQEGVVHVKDQGIPVGPGRGSAAASIVCWLLRITEINPMIFENLVFERFIDVSREDYPDIDLDFPSDARPKLRAYYTAKYGQGTVSNIGTFTVFKGKLAMDDVARVFKVPKFEIQKVKDLLIERSSGDLRASATIEDTVEQFPQAKEVFEKYPELTKSELLEGNIKGFGVHAAGMVLSNHPIEDSGVCAIYRREVPKNSGNIVDVVSLDKYDAERQGMVKIDFLGLSTMSMVQDALRELEMPLGPMYNVDLRDPKVIDGFRQTDVVGVFQFDGQAARSVCGALRPDSFQEVCDVNALCRPGALHNGSASAYADIKHGRLAPKKLHPAVDPILAPTKYQIVYQEQILRICREIGNFPWEKTAEIRKIIAKKHGNAAFNRRKQQFLDGALTVHERQDVPPMDLATIEALWGDMITAGSYGFNAAHATAYGWLAWFTMWLKVYHPPVFYSSALKHMPDHTHRNLLRDAAAHDVRILPPSPAMSMASWQPISASRRMVDKARAAAKRGDYTKRRHRREIMGGYSNMKDIGDKTAEAIIEYRENHGISDWDDLINVKGIGAKTIAKIRELAGSTDPYGAFELDEAVQRLREELGSGDLVGLPQPTHTASEIPMGGPKTEIVWIGTIIKKNIRDIFEQNQARGNNRDMSKIRRPDLNEFAMLICEDDTDTTFVDVDRFSFESMKAAIYNAKEKKDLILVEGVSTGRNTKRAIRARRIWVIDPTDENEE